MKKNKKAAILISLCIAFSISVNAQKKDEVRKELNSMVLKMFTSINNKNFDVIMEMTHPKVFEIVPKDQMKNFIKSTFEGNNEFSIELDKEIPKYKLSELFVIPKDSLDYAFVTYDMKMKMTFKNQEFEDEQKNMMKRMMKLKGMDIKFISNNTIDVLMKDRLNIFLKDFSTKYKWVMVNYDPDSPLFYQILPASLLEASKNFKQNLLIERKKKSEE